MASEKVNPDIFHEEGHETRQVTNVGLADALAQANPSPWTRRMFKLYGFLFIAFLNSCINGYDGSLMGGINAMLTYQKYVLNIRRELERSYVS